MCTKAEILKFILPYFLIISFTEYLRVHDVVKLAMLTWVGIKRRTGIRNRNAEPEYGTRMRNRNPEPESGTGIRNRNPEPECGTGIRNRNTEPECGTGIRNRN